MAAMRSAQRRDAHQRRSYGLRPVLHYLLSFLWTDAPWTQPQQPRAADSAAEALLARLTIRMLTFLYYLLWIYPVYALSFILNRHAPRCALCWEGPPC